jgi:hypothetical protein
MNFPEGEILSWPRSTSPDRRLRVRALLRRLASKSFPLTAKTFHHCLGFSGTLGFGGNVGDTLVQSGFQAVDLRSSCNCRIVEWFQGFQNPSCACAWINSTKISAIRSPGSTLSPGLTAGDLIWPEAWAPTLTSLYGSIVPLASTVCSMSAIFAEVVGIPDLRLRGDDTGTGVHSPKPRE